MKNNIYQIIKEELEGIYQSQEDSNPTLPDFGDRIRSIDEDFKNNTIYAYHATSCDSIEGIELNGIKAGNRSMQGKGIYSFYELNECIGYGHRHIGESFCIVKLSISNYNRILILDKKIAEDILGSENSDIIKQFDKIYGFDYFVKTFIDTSWKKEYLVGNYVETLKDKMRTDYNNNQPKEIMWGLSGLEILDIPSAVIFDGEYGLTVLIKKPEIADAISYYKVNGYNDVSDEIKLISKEDKIKLNISDIINSNDEYIDLRDENINNINDINAKIYQYKNILDNVRNNKEYDYYNKIIYSLEHLLNKLN